MTFRIAARNDEQPPEGIDPVRIPVRRTAERRDGRLDGRPATGCPYWSASHRVADRAGTHTAGADSGRR